MHKPDLALNKLQSLIYHKTKPNKTPQSTTRNWIKKPS